MAEKSKSRSCFVICPIGEAGSKDRARSDDIFNNLIEPVAKENDYEAFRLIDKSRPGDITMRIVEAVTESDLVIADLSGRNANVFYELSIRHALGRPYIHMMDDPASVPFDVFALNAITIDQGSFGGMKKTRAELDAQIKAILAGKENFGNPISRYYENQEIEKRDNPLETQIANLTDNVLTLSRQMGALEGKVSAATDNVYGSERPIDRLLSAIKFTEPSLKVPQAKILGRRRDHDYDDDN